MIQGSILEQMKPTDFDNLAEAVRVCIIDTQGQIQTASPDFFDGLTLTGGGVNCRLEMKDNDDKLVSDFRDIAASLYGGKKLTGWCRIADATPPCPWFRAVLGSVATQSSRRNDSAIIVTRATVATDSLRALQASLAVAEFDITGTIICANERYLSSFGYELADISGQNHSILLFADDATSPDYTRFWAELRKGTKLDAHFRRRDKQGQEIWLQATYCPVSGPTGSPYKVIEFANDITERKRVDADHGSQIDAIRKSMCVVEFTLDGVVVNANEKFLDALGYRIEDVAGVHHSIFVPPELRGSLEYHNFWQRLTEGFFQASQFRRVAKDGSDVWLEAIYNPVTSPSGKPYKIIKLARDVSDQTRQLAAKEYAISHAATHDNLTQVLNRYGLRNRIEEERQKGNRISFILLIDLDGFKPVNDTYGHFVGDEVLREVARRLELIAAERGLVARLGGDEFVVVFNGHTPPDQAPGAIAKELLARLREPITTSEAEIVIGASIGIAVNGDGDDQLDVLLRNADIALYVVKNSGKNGFQIFDA